MSNLALAMQLVTEPVRAFAAIERQPRWVFPLLVVLVASVCVLGWYYTRVDLVWLLDTTLRANPRAAALDEAQLQEVIRRAAGSTTVWWAVLTGVGFILFARLFEGMWYMLAGKLTGVDRSFRQWLALACWTGLPQAVALLAAMPVMLAGTSTQMDPGVMSPLSLNELFFHRPLADPLHDYLAGINLMHAVGLVLAIMGVRAWSGRSWVYASVFVLLPPLVIYGTWGWVALGQA